MALKPKPSPAEGEFLFEIDEEPLEECLAALAGVPLSVRAVRSDFLRRFCVRLLPWLPEPLAPDSERAYTSTVAWYGPLRGGPVHRTSRILVCWTTGTPLCKPVTAASNSRGASRGNPKPS
jgi:hypothetical protein